MLKHNKSSSSKNNKITQKHKPVVKQKRHMKPRQRVNRQLGQITPTKSFSTNATDNNSMEAVRLYTKDQPILPNFDYVVVGGGSGGISSARRAASYGAKVAIIEQGFLGGTCVNLGCIPKKIMWYAASMAHEMGNAESYGFDGLDLDKVNFNFGKMKDNRDAYLRKLNGMYWRNSMRDGIYIIRGKAEFAIDPVTNEPDLTKLLIKPSNPDGQDKSDNYPAGFKMEEFKGKEVFVTENTEIEIALNQDVEAGTYQGTKAITDENTVGNKAKANFVLTAPGGYPIPLKIPGGEFAIDSDGWFKSKKQAKRCAITGAGYIAVEIAQVLASLGTDMTMIFRRDTVLSEFDKTIKEVLMKELGKQTTLSPHSVISRIVKLSAEERAAGKFTTEREFNDIEKKFYTGENANDIDDIFGVYVNKLNAELQPTGEEVFMGYFDQIISAVGRAPATHIMNVPKSVTTKPGHVKVSEMGQIIDERVKNVFAIGDAVGKADLTPVAIQQGRRLSNWLFGGKGANPLIFRDAGKDNGVPIPTVVFSHPPIGTTGLTEQEAIKIYGKENVLIWNAKFTPLYCALLEDSHKYQAVTKFITTKEFCKYTQQDEDVVIGMHLMHPGADEAMQLGAIAVVNRLPVTMIHNTIAIHPTATEEIVTNYAGKVPQ